MSEFLFQYHRVSPTTWVYLSSLLMIGLYFKFSRLWSVRNLDLVLLILLAPGLLLAEFGHQMRMAAVRQDDVEETTETGVGVEEPEQEPFVAVEPILDEPAASSVDTSTVAVEDVTQAEQPLAEPLGDPDSDPDSNADGKPVVMAAAALAEEDSSQARQGMFIELLGYYWLFCTGAVLLLRLLVDPTMVRRPLLPPNLSVGGLTFIGCSLFIFLMANVVASEVTEPSSDVAGAATAEVASGGPVIEIGASDRGPGYALLNALPPGMHKTVAILSHLAIVVGMALIGYWHFHNTTTGIGAALLYLMLPYTALMTGLVDHVLPAALLVSAVLGYRRPLAAGLLLGFASGVVYYPLFLLPLWVSFYWQRGLVRFLAGFLVTLSIMSVLLVLVSDSIVADLQRMFGLWVPVMEGLDGIWNTEIGGWDPVFRLPFLTAFVALAVAFALWPAQKNLGTLMSCSAALMVATQFWHGFGGATIMAWYLPLVLLTVFRPNLEDRVALSVLGEGWRPRMRTQFRAGDRAA